MHQPLFQYQRKRTQQKQSMSLLFYGLWVQPFCLLCLALTDRHTSQSVINMELGNPQLKGHAQPIHIRK